MTDTILSKGHAHSKVNEPVICVTCLGEGYVGKTQVYVCEACQGEGLVWKVRNETA